MRLPKASGPNLPKNSGAPKLNSLIPQNLNASAPKASAPRAKRINLKLPAVRKVRPRVAMPHLKMLSFK